MNDFPSILENHLLWMSLTACLVAQALKLIIELIRYQSLDVRSLFTTGGMPSAHSALVASLATGVGMVQGWDSTEFAIALLFAIIVMFDAAGVRQAAGKQARLLNQMVDELFQENRTFNEEKLKELLGHTPLQVIVGVIVGISVALFAQPWL